MVDFAHGTQIAHQTVAYQCKEVRGSPATLAIISLSKPTITLECKVLHTSPEVP